MTYGFSTQSDHPDVLARHTTFAADDDKYSAGDVITANESGEWVRADYGVFFRPFPQHATLTNAEEREQHEAILELRDAVRELRALVADMPNQMQNMPPMVKMLMGGMFK